MKIFKTWGSHMLATLALCCVGSLAPAAELVIGQVAPLSSALASTGYQMVVGRKAAEIAGHGNGNGTSAKEQ